MAAFLLKGTPMSEDKNEQQDIIECGDCADGFECNCGMNGVASLEDEDALPSICGALVLEDDECIVALGEDGTGFIIARSNDIAEKDVLLENTAEECNFNHDWDNDLVVGVYKLKIKPWASGEDEGGITVRSVTPLWSVPETFQETSH